MTLEELKATKNRKLLALQDAKHKGDRKALISLGSEVAALEGMIAREYLTIRQPEKR